MTYDDSARKRGNQDARNNIIISAGVSETFIVTTGHTLSGRAASLSLSLSLSLCLSRLFYTSFFAPRADNAGTRNAPFWAAATDAAQPHVLYKHTWLE